VARTSGLTLLEVNGRRGAAAMRQIGVLEGYSGTLVRDALASYDAVAPNAAHVLCGAHLLRELTAVSEFLTAHPEHLPANGWDWADQIAWALLWAKHASQNDPSGVCPPDILARSKHLIVSAGVIATENGAHSPPGPVGRTHRALARRITTRVGDYLRFATDPAVPFDNNGSEQDLRMAKLRMKVSGCFRTKAGADQFARLRSYTATATKQGVNAHDAIMRLFTHNPWTPATT
jgi:hypothetical protein